ncbi:DUF6415 family natural product biosynthesis protein [Streptomyces mangrovisoli]|uniref:Uncharacterized protein n=1 Tax=Streptomyces mangrovisoli TaxID=1428628 RepID=A0A1J4NQC3_9ACTN|nr:DUF6415 family natural product biosynthesis protein [Streptomyces mangrovisoli]OIJ64338.1 hypothetical protein WN71_029760 [Streptomyces mangrovisoli]
MRTETPDIETMRDSVTRALVDMPALPAPDAEALDTLAATLRGHVVVLVPEVEALAAQRPEGDVPGRVALACVEEARRKLRVRDGHTVQARLTTVQKLGRVVKALCDHFETLTG